ncbi:MAG: hypothetical protein IKN98_04575 [Bacteroidales bacterium]|nr:hypothetical protein [Bacteroidales bacterium]
MEDNNYQPQYNQPYNQPQYPQPQNDYPQYGQQLPEIDTPDFLPKAVTATALAFVPVASIVAIILGAANRGRIRKYLANGGSRTAKVRVSSILSNVGLWTGVGMTIFYAIYFFVFFMAFLAGTHHPSSYYYY